MKMETTSITNVNGVGYIFLPDCKINQFVKFIYKKKILTGHIKTKNVNNQVNINCNGTYYFCPKFENGMYKASNIINNTDIT